jgi:hypothetical protein
MPRPCAVIFVLLLLSSCRKPDPSIGTACAGSTECLIVQASCCECQGVDGKQPRAMTIKGYGEAQAACASTACEPCPVGYEPGPDPNFVAVCESGTCTALDVRTLPASACAADADCALVPPTCCGCSGEPVAVSRSGRDSLRSRLCGNAQCGPCLIPDYAGLSAACVQGHCVRRGRWKQD